VAIVGETAQVVDVRFDQACFAGAANDAVVEWTGKEFMENCDEIETHSC
jgi:hypothetical protein